MDPRDRWTWVHPDWPEKWTIRDHHRYVLRERVGKLVDHDDLVLPVDWDHPIRSKVDLLPAWSRLARRDGPFHIDGSFAPLQAVRRLRRCVATIHDFSFYTHPQLHAQEPAERAEAWLHARGARRLDAICAISGALADDMARGLGFPRDRIFVTPMAIDQELYRRPSQAEQDEARTDFRRRFGIAEDEASILYMGSWLPRKNVPTLLRAVRILLDRGRKVKLVMRPYPGRDAWVRPVVEAIEGLRLAPHIATAPNMDDPALRPAMYRGADVFVFPTLYDAFGLPPQEAMASGCPVVASDTSAMPEVVNGAGILVPALKPEAFADAIARILDDDTLRRDLVRRGFDHVAGWTWDKAVPGVLAAYEAVSRR